MPQQNLSAIKKEWIKAAVLLAIFVVLYGYGHYLQESLSQHAVIVQGEVTDALVAPKRGKLAYYDFVIKGIHHSGTWFLPAFKNINDRYVIVGHHFPVLVDASNFNNNKMLFDSASFGKYGLQYPDSLVWLKKYLR
jgi:hypothetical protein